MDRTNISDRKAAFILIEQVFHVVQHNYELIIHAKSATYVAIGTGQTQLNLKASKQQTVTLCIVKLTHIHYHLRKHVFSIRIIAV